MGNLEHYSVDVRSLTPEEQSNIYERLNGSCWIVDYTDTPGVYDIYWECKRGDISALPYLPKNCIISKLP